MAQNDQKKSQPQGGDQSGKNEGHVDPPPAPGSDSTPNALEIKQAVITSDQTSGRAPVHLRVPGFRGSYKGVIFDDDGLSDKPVPVAVADELASQFPGAKSAEVPAHKFEPSAEGVSPCAVCGRSLGHSLHAGQ